VKLYVLREHNGDAEASIGGGGGEEIMATGPSACVCETHARPRARWARGGAARPTTSPPFVTVVVPGEEDAGSVLCVWHV
jgi:hypothetical protein